VGNTVATESSVETEDMSAQAALQKRVDELLVRVEGALAETRYEDASAAAEELLRLQPGNAGHEELRGRIDAARQTAAGLGERSGAAEDQAVEPAEPVEPTAPVVDVAATATAAAVQDRRRRAAALQKEVIDALNAGELESALAGEAKLTSLDPNWPGLAELEQRIGALKAEMAAAEADRQRLELVETHLTAARQALEQGDLQQCFSEINTVLGLDPRNHGAQSLLAAIQAESKDPSPVIGKVNRLRQMLEEGKIEQVIAEAETLAAQQPGNEELRGLLEAARQRLDERDTVAPVIASMTAERLESGDAVAFTVSVTDNKGVNEVKLYYRTAREPAFKAVVMSPDGNEFRHSIARSYYKKMDLQYYVIARDSTGNISRYPVLGEYETVMVKETTAPRIKGF
ncbi:hypothetical protein JW905_14085, partial [bacterium]|nr:hypothetical protein [candidate division CSSED10-310 bacterium]